MFRFLIFLSILMCVFSCTSSGVKNRFSEEDRNSDSVKFYKDFDLYTFKGVDSLKQSSIKYPYIKVTYKKDKLILTAFYNESQKIQKELYRFNNHWCYYDTYYSDGSNSHCFTVFTERGFYKFRFLRNPYGKTEEDLKWPAVFYSLTINSIEGKVVKYRYYQSFQWGDCDFKKVPPINSISESEIKKFAQTFIYGEKSTDENNIIGTYQSYRRAFVGGQYIDFEKEGEPDTINKPLKSGSVFFTIFEEL
jgi:hypothetical protein